MPISNMDLAEELRRHARARHALSRGSRQSLLDAAERLEASKAAEQPVGQSFLDKPFFV